MRAVLFTDLVGSTSRDVAIGDARADKIRETHFLLLRRAITGCGGHEVKTIGDSIMAQFDSRGRCNRLRRLDAAGDRSGQRRDPMCRPRFESVSVWERWRTLTATCTACQ